MVNGDDDESDEEERTRAMGSAAFGALPPALRHAMATLQEATRRGDMLQAANAAQQLEAEVKRAPPEFQEALAQARELRQQGTHTRGAKRPASKPAKQPKSPQRAGGASAAVALTAMPSTAGLDAQLQALDSAQQQLSEALQDPTRLAAWLASNGVSEQELHSIEASDDRSDAMQTLAARMVKATIGGAAPKPDALFAQLAEQRRRMQEAERLVAEEQRAAETAAAGVKAAQEQLDLAQRAKAEQGAKVDASLQAAKQDVAGEVSHALHECSSKCASE